MNSAPPSEAPSLSPQRFEDIPVGPHDWDPKTRTQVARGVANIAGRVFEPTDIGAPIVPPDQGPKPSDWTDTPAGRKALARSYNTPSGFAENTAIEPPNDAEPIPAGYTRLPRSIFMEDAEGHPVLRPEWRAHGERVRQNSVLSSALENDASGRPGLAQILADQGQNLRQLQVQRRGEINLDVDTGRLTRTAFREHEPAGPRHERPAERSFRAPVPARSTVAPGLRSRTLSGHPLPRVARPMPVDRQPVRRSVTRQILGRVTRNRIRRRARV